MKKRHITPSLLASFFAIAPLSLQAEDCCMPEYQPGSPLCDDQVCTIYPAYSGINIDCGFDLYGYGEFLYWAPINAASFVATTFEGNPRGSTQIELVHKNGYRPAFRLGLGGIMHDLDSLTMEIEYTWYHHTFKKTFSETLPNTIASSVGAFTNPIYSSVTDKFKAAYDIVGMKAGRPNYLGQRMIFSPFLSVMWLKRDLKISQNLLRAGTNLFDRQHTTLKWSSIGVGAGAELDWLLCWGMYLIGKTDFALMYPYSRRNVQVATTAEGIISKLRIPNKHLDVLNRSRLGIGWGKYFCCNHYHLDLSASFDLLTDITHLDFNAGMFDKGLAMLFGWTIHCKLDF